MSEHDRIDVVWVEDRRWSITGDHHDRRCSHPRCFRPAVAMNAGTRAYRGGSIPRLLYHCVAHLKDRRIEGGKVLVAVDKDSPEARRGWKE